jgi:ABC-type Fe2+-enterobactin transport system substrate-binding protein
MILLRVQMRLINPEKIAFGVQIVALPRHTGECMVTNLKVAEQLSKIAPIVFLDEEKMDVWNDWPGVMTKFGEILGQESTAKQAIDKFTANSSQAKDQLKHVNEMVRHMMVKAEALCIKAFRVTFSQKTIFCAYV